jgi:hypothetical protein
VQVDPATGDRTVVSGCTEIEGPICVDPVGGGPFFQLPQGIAVEADGQLVIADWGLRGLVRIDPSTGFRRIVSRRSYVFPTARHSVDPQNLGEPIAFSDAADEGAASYPTMLAESGLVHARLIAYLLGLDIPYALM